MEGEQREQVVEKPDAGRDVRPAAAVERERDAERRLGARADERCLAPGRAAGLGSEGSQEEVVLGRPPEGHPDPLREPADDDALLLEPRAEIVLAADPDEVARHRRRVEAGRDEGLADALALGELRREVVAGIAERCSGDPRGGSGDRRRRPARLEHCSGRRSCDRVPDPERGVAERLRHRSQHDQVRALAEPGHDGLAAVLDVGLVDDHRSVGMALRELDELGRRGDGARWVVGVAAPDQARAVSAVRPEDRIGAGEQRRDAVERVGRRDDRGRPPRREVGARTEQDEIVRSRADDDLLPATSAPPSRETYAAAASRRSRYVPSG